MITNYTRREELKERLSLDQSQLAAFFGDDEAGRAAVEELNIGSQSVWTGEIALLEEELSSVEARFAQANRSYGVVQKELEEVFESTRIEELDEKIGALKCAAVEAGERWRRAALARELLRRALEKYTRERQPGVLKEASRLFCLVTGGRYPRVIQKPGEEGISVERADGAYLNVNELSRGTMEELYLCLRLGLASDFATRGTNLPLLADDVFVNFDPERCQAMMGAVASYAAKGQALLLTCHPETSRRILEVDPTAKVFKLDRDQSISISRGA